MTTHEVSHGHTWPPRQYSRMPCLPAQFYGPFTARKLGWGELGRAECLRKERTSLSLSGGQALHAQWSWPSYGFCLFPHGSIGTQYLPFQQESTCFIGGTWQKPQEIRLHCWATSSSLFLRDEIWSCFSLSHKHVFYTMVKPEEYHKGTFYSVVDVIAASPVIFCIICSSSQHSLGKRRCFSLFSRT